MAGKDRRPGFVGWACRQAIGRYLRWGEIRQLDDACMYFDQLPESYPGRAVLAAELIDACRRTGVHEQDVYMARLVAWADLLDAAPIEERAADWAEKATSVRILSWHRALKQADTPGTYNRAVAFLADERGREFAGHEAVALLAEVHRLDMLLRGGTLELGVSELRQLLDETAALGRRIQAGGPGEAVTGVLSVLFDNVQAKAMYLEAESRGDRADADAAFFRIQQSMEAADRLLGRPESDDAAELFARLSPSGTGAGPEAVLERSVARGFLSPAEAAAVRAEELADLMREDDPASLDRAVEAWEQAVRLADGEGSADWMIPESAAHAYLARVLVFRDAPGVPGAPDDLARCIELYEQAMALAAPLPQFRWTRITDPLATAYKLSGLQADAARTALAGLRGNAWSALLQNDPTDVEEALTQSSMYAQNAARMLLDDPENAARALEAGRGLILFAARQLRDAGPRLTALGHSRLAEQWMRAVRAAGTTQVPADLRLRVIAALAGAQVGPDGLLPVSAPEAGFRLLAPPEPAEIQAALGVLDADALVYLVAGDEDLIGFAVIVPAHGPVGYLSLPDLEAIGSEGFERFVGALSRATRARDLTPDPTIEFKVPFGTGGRMVAPRDIVGSVCDWAWQVAIGPLLQHISQSQDSASAEQAAPDRPPRLILVPMQEMALIPWHAARTVADGQEVYALEYAVFSYAASARMVVDAAAQNEVALGGAGLVVGDPDAGPGVPGLPAARTEAAAIRTAFYPGAGYVGRLPQGGPGADPGPDGEGSAEQVKTWLADPGAGAVLHLACHGVVRPGVGRDDSSYLLLARGSRLSAEEMVATLADSRSGEPGGGIGLAVLAACSTATSGRGYDEAFNLGTALLAGGARAVISAQWPVPDTETSVLMFMVHFFVRETGMRPVDALRAAQLWILRDLRPPECMPEELRRSLPGIGTVDITAWAGFVHSGR